MNIEDTRIYALSLPGVTEDMPYGPDWVVFRIEGKIFMHIWLEAPQPAVAVKLPPEDGVILRDKYEYIKPAYHLNKTHWNDIYIQHFADDDIVRWIKQSYLLVVNHLPRRLKNKYQV